jgi:D-hexose-6-phosphate mutarotase
MKLSKRIQEEFSAFAIPGAATFVETSGGLTALDLATDTARARIYLQGAHVAEWKPGHSDPVLFMSGRSHFAPGKAIRGGVPVCFPWFANRAGVTGAPAHGFARTTEWSVESLHQTPNGEIDVAFDLSDTPASREHWPYAFAARYRVRIGLTLSMTLEVENTGAGAFSFEEALHTYFRVSDVGQVEVGGLENTEFIDKVDAFSRKRLGSEPLRFSSETDRVFVKTASTCVLRDPGLRREIVVEKSGSATTVVWNPWSAKAKAMADFGDDEWPGMLCIETANTGENSITLPGGQKHTMTATVFVR